jgi:hypothetical protein
LPHGAGDRILTGMDDDATTGGDPRARFRRLPEAVRPEQTVETVDAGTPRPVETGAEERTRLLELAGGGTP